MLDYGSGNLHSAQRALARVGAEVEVTADHNVVMEADGLVVPGVGAYAACMAGLTAVRGERMIGQFLAGGRPVWASASACRSCSNAESSSESSREGCGEWPGSVERLHAEILPHMGWNTVDAPADSVLFAGLDPDTRFYFVHSYAAQKWTLQVERPFVEPKLTWAEHGGRFLAAVENGPLSATQFHPEKSGDAGAALLRNWVHSL